MDLIPAAAVPALNQNQLGTVLGWIVLLILGSGLLVVIFRVAMEGTPKYQRKDTASDKTLIRSWLAVALAGGLLFFAAASFLIDDANLRNLLMGGVVASAGSAIAFTSRPRLRNRHNRIS
jgi:NhaP-type Na+/H+ and K+/H+ antiporter